MLHHVWLDPLRAGFDGVGDAWNSNDLCGSEYWLDWRGKPGEGSPLPCGRLSGCRPHRTGLARAWS